MNYQLKALLSALLLIFLCSLFWALIFMSYDIGLKAHEMKMIEQCKTSNTITIQGKEIRCAMVQAVDSIEAARYRSVKNCTKIIKEWGNE